MFYYLILFCYISLHSSLPLCPIDVRGKIFSHVDQDPLITMPTVMGVNKESCNAMLQEIFSIQQSLLHNKSINDSFRLIENIRFLDKSIVFKKKIYEMPDGVKIIYRNEKNPLHVNDQKKMRSIILFIRFFAQATGVEPSVVGKIFHCHNYLNYHNDFFFYALVPQTIWHYGKSYFLLLMANYGFYDGLFESQFYKELDLDYVNYCNMRNNNFTTFIKNNCLTRMLPIEVLRFFCNESGSIDDLLPYIYKEKSTEVDFAKKKISFNLQPFMLSN